MLLWCSNEFIISLHCVKAMQVLEFQNYFNERYFLKYTMFCFSTETDFPYRVNWAKRPTCYCRSRILTLCTDLWAMQYFTVFFSFFSLLFQEPIKSRAPQLHLEYRFYKQLGNSGKREAVRRLLVPDRQHHNDELNVNGPCHTWLCCWSGSENSDFIFRNRHTDTQVHLKVDKCVNVNTVYMWKLLVKNVKKAI